MKLLQRSQRRVMTHFYIRKQVLEALHTELEWLSIPNRKTVDGHTKLAIHREGLERHTEIEPLFLRDGRAHMSLHDSRFRCRGKVVCRWVLAVAPKAMQ